MLVWQQTQNSSGSITSPSVVRKTDGRMNPAMQRPPGAL